MTETLRFAFANANGFPGNIIDLYHRAGFWLWRALMDDSFLSVSATEVSSEKIQYGLSLYEQGKEKAQEALYDLLKNKTARGEFYPQPDIKPGLMKMAEFCLPYLYRINWMGPQGVLVVALACTAAHVLSQGNLPALADPAASGYSALQPALSDRQEKAATPCVQPSIS